MVEAIVAYLLELAKSRRYQWTNPLTEKKETVGGRLRIYTDHDDCPYASDCISLPQLVNHLAQWGASEQDVKRAIGSLWPTAGVGKKLHVWFYTEKRANEVRLITKDLARHLKSKQRANLRMYLAEFGVTEEAVLPDFTQISGTVQ